FGPVPTRGKGRGGRNITRASSATRQATAPPLATIDTVPTTTERATPLAPHTAPPPAHTTQAPSGTSHNVATGSPPVTIGAATGPAVAIPLCEDGDTPLEGDLYDSNRLDEEEDSPALKGKVGRPSNIQVRAVEKLIQELTVKIDDTVAATGLGRELVVRKLMHAVAGPLANRTTIWHRFVKYAYHKDRRLDVVRLADPDFEAPGSEWLPTQAQVSASWNAFTALHTRDQQEEILSVFEEEKILLGEETVRDRQRAFEKGYEVLTAGVSHCYTCRAASN
ncbi:MAG TPA: hypothetical protein VN828_10785, partial [Acidobacteriaceae bacterium]|nr:hypothetical protein [Acidobacteriaceae bacterium]